MTQFFIKHPYRKPQTLHEFAIISGVGKRKLESYGEAFIEVIAMHNHSEDLTARSHSESKESLED